MISSTIAMASQHARLIDPRTSLLPVTALQFLGDAVSMRVLVALSTKEQRFGDLSTLVSRTSTKTLSARLKRLANAGLVTRTLYAEVPPRAEYALTDKGRELLAIVQGISDWERSWRPENT